MVVDANPQDQCGLGDSAGGEFLRVRFDFAGAEGRRLRLEAVGPRHEALLARMIDGGG